MLPLQRQEALRERYRALRPGWQPALERYATAMRALATPNARLLDVGCGPGGLAREHGAGAARIVGLDAYATHFQEPAELHTLVAGDGTALPFADGTFTLVTASWVLEHLPDPARVFREVWRVLAPGGHFAFITPNAANPVVWLRQGVPALVSKRVVSAIYARNEDFINPTFYRANTLAQVRALAVGAGLHVDWLETVSDPTYLALTPLLFRAAVLFEDGLARLAPARRIHLVGLLSKRA